MAEDQKKQESAASAAAQQAAAKGQKPVTKTTTKVPATEAAPVQQPAGNTQAPQQGIQYEGDANTPTPIPPPVTTPTPTPAPAPVQEPVPDVKPVTEPEEDPEEDDAEIAKSKAFSLKMVLAAHKAGEITPEEFSELPTWAQDHINEYEAGLRQAREDEAETRRVRDQEFQNRLLEAAEEGKKLHDERTKKYGQGYVVASKGSQVTIFTAKAWNMLSRDTTKAGGTTYTGTRDGWKEESTTPPEVLALQNQQYAETNK